MLVSSRAPAGPVGMLFDPNLAMEARRTVLIRCSKPGNNKGIGHVGPVRELNHPSHGRVSRRSSRSHQIINLMFEVSVRAAGHRSS